MIYEPLVCLILQGEKLNVVNGQPVTISAGQFIVVSHAMPVVSRVQQASPEAPYLSLLCRLDLSELRSLHGDIGDAPLAATTGPAFSVATASAALRSVFTRYASLADDADDARVLAPLVRRELHYRLLKSEGGGLLRSLLRRDSHASSIARAIQTLRRDYRDRLEMGALAQSVGMSASSFYKHFKAVTATTPLQYQKDLRLTEARRLLLGGVHSVSSAAYTVGYESPSQFSREYSRKFGDSPLTDRAPS